jgi:hypothetical protein
MGLPCPNPTHAFTGAEKHLRWHGFLFVLWQLSATRRIVANYEMLAG